MEARRKEEGAGGRANGAGGRVVMARRAANRTMMRRFDPSPWRAGRATLYGAAIGAAAAAFRLLAPWSGPQSPVADAREIVGAAIAFALLCGLAATLRNFIVRQLVSPPAK